MRLLSQKEFFGRLPLESSVLSPQSSVLSPQSSVLSPSGFLQGLRDRGIHMNARRIQDRDSADRRIAEAQGKLRPPQDQPVHPRARLQAFAERQDPPARTRTPVPQDDLHQ